MSPRLDWIPLKVYRLIESDAWKLPDYKFCWYMKLLIKSVTANPAGYLPGSVSELWQLAGAKSEAYFVKWGGPELVSRYFKRTDDGTNRIYNARMLEIIGEQSHRLCKKESSRSSSSLSLSVVGSDVVFEVVQRLFEYYRDRFQRLSTYTLTESRKKKCLARLDELMRSQKCDIARAEELARQAIDNLAGSTWHREHGHIDWTAQIFRSQEEFQKRLEFRPVDDSAFLRRGPDMAIGSRRGGAWTEADLEAK